jgi:hypothetical protein
MMIIITITIVKLIIVVVAAMIVTRTIETRTNFDRPTPLGFLLMRSDLFRQCDAADPKALITSGTLP